jgi:tetratricopeptide (TPR) repeat protein
VFSFLTTVTENHVTKLKAEQAMVTAMSMQKKVAKFEEVFRTHNYENAVEALVPIKVRNATVLLMAARCYQQLGKNSDALKASAMVIQKTATYTPWKRGQLRMIASMLSANAAMEIGSTKQALKIYQTVLKFDPDQKQIREQYKGLKKVVKRLAEVDEQVEKGYNKKAMELIYETEAAMRGLDVDSPIFRSVIEVKMCKVLSSLQKHEEALISCDSAVTQRQTAAATPGVFTDPKLLSEARLARCAFFDRNLHSRMPLGPTHVRLKQTRV